jgi:phenylalanyl-tRNA synthetase alpha chain
MDDLRLKYVSAIAGASDETALEDLRVAALGKKGEISLKMRELGQMAPEERQATGAALNRLKDEIDGALARQEGAWRCGAGRAAAVRMAGCDPAGPAAAGMGTIHPVSQVTEEVTAIFADMGFAVAEGPQIESDWFNFDALNIPPEHPARQEHDTFFMARAEGDNRPAACAAHPYLAGADPRHADQGAPIRVIAPGRVYRMDMDQTHTPMFHQVEGLAIDRDISHGEPEMGAGGILPRLFRGGPCGTALPRQPLPLHRALGRGRYPLLVGGRPAEDRRGRQLDGDSGLGHGPSEGAGGGGRGPDRMAGLCLRHGHRPDRHAEIRHPDLRAFFESDLRWLKHYGFSALDMPTIHGGLSR